MIQQGMTIQLFPSLSSGGVMAHGRSLPCLSCPGQPGGAQRLGLCLITSGAAWPDSVGAKFLFIFPDFFGVGKLRNVECCNVGKGGVEKRDPALLPHSSSSARVPGGSWHPLAPQSPRQASLNIALSPHSSVGRDLWPKPHLEPQLLLRLPVFESPKRSCGSAADET